MNMDQPYLEQIYRTTDDVMENVYSHIQHDRLVLYLEEVYDGEPDAKCYVVYDEVEKEYFVCGSRLDVNNQTYGNYKFYCYSERVLLDYLQFVLNADSSLLTYGLYNYQDIFSDTDMIDYTILESKRSIQNEIVVYVESEFKKKQLAKLLVMLRKMRY
jgi:hypothetical protein